MNNQLEFFLCTTYKDGYKVPNHTHPCYEIVYYLEGDGTIYLDKNKYNFLKDTFCIIAPNTIHNEQSENGAKVIFMGFITTEYTLASGLYNTDSQTIKELMLAIGKEFEKKDYGYKQMISSLLDQLILHIVRQQYNQTNVLTNFDDILDYIKKEANKNISIKEIAYNFGYSYDYFRQMFVQKLGFSAKDYIMSIKLQNVKELLANTDYGIYKISSITGFSSPSHLCMVFKKEFGMSPMAYREIQKNHDFVDNQVKIVEDK